MSRVRQSLVALRFLDYGVFAGFDRVDVNRFALEGAGHGNIDSREASRLALRVQFIDVAPDPEAIFRTFTYASVDAFLVRRHVFFDLAICAAVRVGDKAVPCLLRLCGLSLDNSV